MVWGQAASAQSKGHPKQARGSKAPAAANTAESQAAAQRLKHAANIALEELLRRARAAEKEQRPLDARRLYYRAVQLYPDSGAALLALGRLYEKTGDYTQAKEFYRRALLASRHAGDPTAALLRLSKAEGATDDLDAAALHLREAAEFNHSQRLWLRLASWYTARHAYVAALNVWRRLQTAEDRQAPAPSAPQHVAKLSSFSKDIDPVLSGSERNWVRKSLAKIAAEE